MANNRLVTAVIAVLAVTAIATAAATLHTDRAPVAGENGPTLGGPGGPESGTAAGLVGSESVPAVDASSPLLRALLRFGLLFVALSTVIGSYLFYRVYGLRGSSVAVLVVSLLVFSVAVFFLLGGLTPESVDPGGNAGVFGEDSYSLPGGGDASGTEITPIVRNVPVILFLGIGFVAVIGAVVAVRSKGGDAGEPSTAESVESNEMASVGETAGRTATRVSETADPTNELFRAWKDMTTHLDVERPRSSTPEEFATAAAEAGMDRGDVAELTDLFRRARYGDTPITREREERAVAVLRRIEATNGETAGERKHGKTTDRTHG